MLDPLLVELVRRIPKPGSEWPAGPRLRWFRVMAAALDLVYMDDGAEASLCDPSLIEVSLQLHGSQRHPSAEQEDIIQPSWLDCPDHIPGARFLNIFPPP